MANEFNPLQKFENALDLKYTIENLYFKAFPSLANMALMKIDGLEDKLVGAAEKGISKLDKGNRLGLTFRDVKAIETNEGDPISYLGTPVFMPMKFKGGTYIVNDNGKLVERDGFDDVWLPATTTAEFRRSKNIVESNPSNQKGSVKEQWSTGDWDITVRGLILTEGDRQLNDHPWIFPEEKLKALLKYESVFDSIEVEGGLFGPEYFNIKRLVIRDGRFAQVSGKPYTIPFQFSCSSDENFEIIKRK